MIDATTPGPKGPGRKEETIMIKTAKELAKIADARKDWKHLKLWAWSYAYEKQAEEWNNIFPPVSDDRRMFINTYNMVYQAIDSMTDNPHSWVCVAISQKVAEEKAMMDRIIERFKA